MAGEDGISISVDPAQFAQLLKSLKSFSPVLATATRKNLRAAGQDTVRAIQAELTGGSFRSGKSGDRTSFRQQLAAGTKLAIVAGTTRSGITITTTGANLPDNSKGLRVAWNSATFRHPVPNTSKYVSQSGRPYFGSKIRDNQPAFEAAVSAALEQAIQEMNR